MTIKDSKKRFILFLKENKIYGIYYYGLTQYIKGKKKDSHWNNATDAANFFNTEAPHNWLIHAFDWHSYKGYNFWNEFYKKWNEILYE